MAKIFKISIGLLLLLSAACQKKILVEADRYARNGELGQAELALTRHLETHPNDHAARFQLGDLHGRMGQYRQMMNDFAAVETSDSRWQDKIMNRKDFFWRENFNRGVANLKSNEAQQAIAPLRQAILIFPERHAAYPSLAAAIIATPDSGGALPLFEKACSLNANDLDSRRALLQFYYTAARYQEALRVSEEILQKSMHDVSALRCRALALQYVYPDQAEAAFEALLRQSADADDWLAFAMFYYRRQNYKYARLLFQEVLKSREVDTTATAGQPISNNETNHSAKSLNDERSTPLAEIYRYLGDCSWHLGDYTAMSLWYTRLVEAKPTDTAALQNLLIAAQALGKQDDAEYIKKQLGQLKSGQE